MLMQKLYTSNNTDMALYLQIFYQKGIKFNSVYQNFYKIT